MSASSIVHDWRTNVRDLLPGSHGHQANALADLSLAVALAGDCRAGRVAPRLPTATAPASTRRRFEADPGRLLCRERVALRPAAARPDGDPVPGRDRAGGPGVGPAGRAGRGIPEGRVARGRGVRRWYLYPA